MTAPRFSLHQLPEHLRKQAQDRLAALGTTRTNVIKDDDFRSYEKKPKAQKIPKLSEPEERLAFHLKAEGITFEREFKWCPGRKYRADFAIPALRLLIEVQGGVHSGGRHTRGKGYSDDRLRSNLAVSYGWRILEFTPGHIKNGDAINLIKRVLES